MSTKAQAAPRLIHVDILRGLAVVFMLVLHTAHGWLRPEAREGVAEAVIRGVGGMAAPLFLWLSGVSLGLRWGARDARGLPPDARGEVARGLQLVLLGYVLRIQMWMIDGGGAGQALAWLTASLLAGGELGLYVALGRYARGLGGGPRLPALSGAGVIAGFALVVAYFPARLEGLLRVDVLQAIGASLAVVGAASHPLRNRPALLYACGAAVACLTPLARAWVPGPLPEPVAAYVARWTPAPGQQPLAMFPLFPWLSYVWFGAALAPLWERRAAQQRLLSTLGWGAVVGAALAVATWEGHDWAGAWLKAWPALGQPWRVLHRVGVGLTLAGIAPWLARTPLASGLLRSLGGASLLVYWVHLEFAFGQASAPWRKELGLGAWLAGLTALTLAMTGLAKLRLRHGALLKTALKSAGYEGGPSRARPTVNSET